MIAAIVLAAGASERMGQAKADLQMPGGTSFLESILTTLRRLRVPAWVVVGPDDRRAAPPGAELVVNPDPSRGMLSSLQCGLRALPPGTGAVIVWPVDHPRVEPGTIATLIAAQRAHGAPVVLPRKDGRRGHPVVFAGGALEELAGLPESGNAGEIVHAHDDRLELEVDDTGIADDIDDPEAYARAFGQTP